jgi:hypothetical protein
MSKLDIVDLIEKNPITRLSNATYQNKLINKIKDAFNDDEQQLFIASFYCYLKYDAKTEFVIDFDDIWKWLDFSNKDKAKRLLCNIFTSDIDYKCLLTLKGEQKNGRGGHNKETILLTINAFKRFCLKADTKKADKIHEYYIKLEETLQDVVNEQTNEILLQLEDKSKQLENILNSNESEKERIREKTILEQFPNNVQCIYYGAIDNINENNERLVKFGCSNCLSERIAVHKKTFINFRLINAFKVNNKTHVENAIKHHEILSKYRRHISLRQVNYTELFAVNELSFDDIDIHIKKIIQTLEYNTENYLKLLDENTILQNKYDSLIKEYENLKSQTLPHINVNETDESIVMKSKYLLVCEENEKLKNDNMKLIRKYKIGKVLNTEDVESAANHFINDNEYNAVTKSMKRIAKSSDGFFYIGDYKYSKYLGTREEVWNRVAYKTSGGLIKENLITNKYNKIVSKNKFIDGKQSNRLETVNKERQQKANIVNNNNK